MSFITALFVMIGQLAFWAATAFFVIKGYDFISNARRKRDDWQKSITDSLKAINEQLSKLKP